MNEWINVKDKLPNKEDIYLCYYILTEGVNRLSTGMEVLYYSSFLGRFKLDFDGQKVTHWMNLPKKPQDK